MLSVAQLHWLFFNPTQTFIYNYITSFKRILPVCIAFKKDNLNNFPIQTPIVQLYKQNTFLHICRVIRINIYKNKTVMKFDLPNTFKAIDNYNIKVIHAHFGMTGFLALALKEKSGLPLITTFYGQDVSEFPNKKGWAERYAELFTAGDKFLVEGPFMKNQLIKIGCHPDKIAIQRIAIIQYKYPYRERMPKTRKESVKILFCGTFREKKGLEYALKAVSRVHSNFPNLEFRIIGDGKLRSNIVKIIKSYNMSTYTKLLGFQNHENMIKEMDRSDIFIGPSVTASNGDNEGGAPTTILEAQACGLPVISTYHADIPNIVRPGKSALLAPERDVDELSKNLTTLLYEQERWKEMGEYGKNFVDKHHAIEKEVENLENIYFNLVKPRITDQSTDRI